MLNSPRNDVVEKVSKSNRVSLVHQRKLPELKKMVDNARISFKPNNKRFHEFQKFIFETAIDTQDESTLRSMGKPIIECNISNSPVSRLCGEYYKQMPSISVSPEIGDPEDLVLIEILEGHIRHIFDDANRHNTQYELYRDTLSGGFSIGKVYTKYPSSMSMDPVICFRKVYCSTTAGFDPLAREVSKCDADFDYEIFPMLIDDFKRRYPHANMTGMAFAKQSESGMDWSYGNAKGEKIVLICEMHVKKKKKVKIVKVAGKEIGESSVMTVEQYENFVESFKSQGFTEQPPAIIGEPRWTEIVSVMSYRFTEVEILEVKKIPSKYLPLVFFDGDSYISKNDESESMQQFTKPYIYHAKGLQRLTNFSAQVIANDFENMVMHKFMVAEESLPDQEEYLDAYKNYQIGNLLVYKAFLDNNPNQPLPPPQPIPRVGLPPEVMNSFNSCMSMLQNILGSYDASLGINDNQLSSLAIIESATQSNSSAMPYLARNMQSLTQVAQIILDLIPKVYPTSRTIPVLAKNGERSFAKINQIGGVNFNYDEGALKVTVEAGVNFAIAKNQALKQIIALMSSSQLFSEFINTEGLDVLLDNMEFRNVDIVKDRADKFMKKIQAQQAQMQKMPNPQVLDSQTKQKMVQVQQAKLQTEAQKTKIDAVLKVKQQAIDKQNSDNDRLKIMIDAGLDKHDRAVELAKAHAEEKRAQAALGLEAADHLLNKEDQHHRHLKEAAELAHRISNQIEEGV